MLLVSAGLFLPGRAIAQKRPVGYIDRSVLERDPYEHYHKIEQSLTVLNNSQKVLPLVDVSPGRIAAVSVVPDDEYRETIRLRRQRYNTFLDHVSNYTPASLYLLPADTAATVFGDLVKELEAAEVVIIGLHGLAGEEEGIPAHIRLFIEQLSAGHQVVVACFGEIAALSALGGASPLVWAPDDRETARSLVPQLIFGAIPAQGKLPEDVDTVFREGDGDEFASIQRLKYTIPEELGIPAGSLDEVDAIVEEGMAARAFPGAVVMAARDGKVFYWKSFGRHRYEVEQAWQVMDRNDVFDLASITKIAATVMATMKLQEQGKIDLDGELGDYLPEAREAGKGDILIKELLTHQAGLTPFIRFWIQAMETPDVFSADSSSMHPYRVAQDLYIHKDYFEKEMWTQMLNSPLKNRGRYVYSDLSMYFMRAVVEAVTGERIDRFLEHTYYKPLGLATMGFHPRDRISLEQIVPTEYDRYFRMQLLQGDVHDEGAAMAGGISGHAGLFSNANDLMILGQLLLNTGEYGNKRYLNPATVPRFNTQPYPGNKRVLGFDKPDPDPRRSPVPEEVSERTFGHTGFTGTCIWIDPESRLVYVFLSNRVHPSRTPNKLASMDIRSRIQQVFYDVLQTKPRK